MEVEIDRDGLLAPLESLARGPVPAAPTEGPKGFVADQGVFDAAVSLHLAEEEAGMLRITRSGQQFLDLEGDCELATLALLAHQVDDLVARSALREATRRVIEDLSRDLVQGKSPEHFRDIAPNSLPDEIDRVLAVRLFAAANSLVARLAEGGRPQCIAEDIVGALITETARKLLRSE